MNEQIEALYRAHRLFENMPDDLKDKGWDAWDDSERARYDTWKTRGDENRRQLYQSISEVAGESYRQKQAEIVTEFWCQFLADEIPPKHDTGNRMDTEREVRGHLLALVIIDKMHEKQPSGKIEEFRSSLFRLIDKELSQFIHVGVGVDYHPDRIISEACHEAGIEVHFCSTFPAKTMSWVYPDRVVAKIGYGGKLETLMTCLDFSLDASKSTD